jgi:hypothetical protein
VRNASHPGGNGQYLDISPRILQANDLSLLLLVKFVSPVRPMRQVRDEEEEGEIDDETDGMTRGWPETKRLRTAMKIDKAFKL